jgi:5-methylcytosine-specific restriction endonuclease McrA
MEVNVPLILNELPGLDYWRSVYENKMQAKIAFKIAKKVFIRTRLAEAQNWKCCWCGGLCTPQRNKYNSATIEHVNPQSEGGPDDWNNYAMSCHRCNNARGTRSVERFAEMVEAGNFKEERETLSNSQRRAIKKAAEKKRQQDVLRALKNSGENPFEEGTKEYKMFKRYTRSDFLDVA